MSYVFILGSRNDVVLYKKIELQLFFIAHRLDHERFCD